MAYHKLKTDPSVFNVSWNGFKNYEIRKNDRDFQVGDNLNLCETAFTGAEIAEGSELIYTGRELDVRVMSILHGPIYGIEDGWVILGIEIL